MYFRSSSKLVFLHMAEFTRRWTFGPFRYSRKDLVFCSKFGKI